MSTTNLSDQSFSELFDTLLVGCEEAYTDHGEDSLFAAVDEEGAVVSVYDGCGGLGSKVYASYSGHTAAYMASRAVSGAVHDWYIADLKGTFLSHKEIENGLRQTIMQGFKHTERYALENNRISGSLVRKFPTTMAMAYARKEQDAIALHIFWAGDSRVYLLSEKGLAQLTEDDTDAEDALENLSGDGALTNVLSGDGRFVIHSRVLRLKGPAIILAATDGCFGYLPTPMHFEYVLLQSMAESDSPEIYRNRLRSELADCAGDDLSFCMMSFMYGSFDEMKRRLRNRCAAIYEEYVALLDETDDEETLLRLWRKYKENYHRFLKKKEA